MTGNFSSESGRKMLPSRWMPSGMRTFTSRSTTTSYFRSEVDHVRVNIKLASLAEFSHYYRRPRMSTQSTMTLQRSERYSPTRPGRQELQGAKAGCENHRSTLLSEYRTLD